MDMRETPDAQGTENQSREKRSVRYTQDCLSEIEEIVDSGKSVLVAGRKIVDAFAITKLTQEARQALPECFKKSEFICEKRDNILASASEKAADMVNAANAEYDRAVAEAQKWSDDTVSRAQEQAESIISEANNYAKATEAGANEKARVIVSTAEAQRNKLISESSVVSGAQQEAGRLMQECQARINEMMTKTEEACTLARKQADEWAVKRANEAYNYVMGILNSSAQHYAGAAEDISSRMRAIQSSVKKQP